MLELDHVIRFVPERDSVDLAGFTVEPGRVHTGRGRGTRAPPGRLRSAKLRA